ncbi:MAG: 3-hydroxyacyl-CoA dehydrogenase family protein [Chitinophagaceae bacterium]
MNLVLLADNARKIEFLSLPVQSDCNLQWYDQLPADPGSLMANMVIDLLFDNGTDRISWLRNTGAGLIMVHSMDPVPEDFIAINGWPGFTGRALLEATCHDSVLREQADNNAALLNRQIEWIPSNNGFISARIISCIINEGYLALEEGTASREGIDTAMKLGTNYPHGPFEWADFIGLVNVLRQLERMQKENPDYQVSMLLKEKALAQ